jgi:hypothetical protein
VSELRAKAKQHEQNLGVSIKKSASSSAHQTKPADTAANGTARRRSVSVSQELAPRTVRPVVVLLGDQKLQRFHNPSNPNCLFSPIRSVKSAENKSLKSISANSLIDELNFYENLHLYENQLVRNSKSSVNSTSKPTETMAASEKSGNGGAMYRSQSIDTNLNETEAKKSSSPANQTSKFMLFVDRI